MQTELTAEYRRKQITVGSHLILYKLTAKHYKEERDCRPVLLEGNANLTQTHLQRNCIN